MDKSTYRGENKMIHGVKNWNKPIRYSQNNNAIERILKLRFLEKTGSSIGYLESCSASSFCTILEGIGAISPEELPTYNGLAIQPEDFFMCLVNDPNNDDLFNQSNILHNRDLHTWERVAKQLKLSTEYLRLPSFSQLCDHILSGHGCILQMPGHYVAAIAYDDTKIEILYHDPWDGNPLNKNKGNKERLSNKAFGTIGVARALAIWR
jgi:hypothetical protein